MVFTIVLYSKPYQLLPVVNGGEAFWIRASFSLTGLMSDKDHLDLKVSLKESDNVDHAFTVNYIWRLASFSLEIHSRINYPPMVEEHCITLDLFPC